MIRKIFFLAFFLFCSVLNHAQNEQGLQEIPEPLHFQLKAIQKGKTMLKLDTRKQEFTIRPQKQANDTTIQFRWSNKEKIVFAQYLNQDNVLERLEKISIPRPDNISQTEKLLYFSIEKGNLEKEFWIRPETIGDRPERDFVSGFTRDLITLFLRNTKAKKIPVYKN